MPIISTLVSEKLFYEDVVAYHLRYPEVMFLPDSPGFPLNPDDMEDCHKFALSHPKPNMTRGKDVGWQNFVTDSQFIPLVDLGTIQAKGPTMYKNLFAFLKKIQMQENNMDYGSRPAFLRINLKNVIMRNAYRVYYSDDGVDVIEPFVKIPGYLPVSSFVFYRRINDVKKYFNGPSPSFDTAYYNYTKQSFKTFPYMLFAREDICTTVPSKKIEGFEMFEADFSKTTTDINLMYTNIGVSSKNEPKVVVLKCFLRAFRPKFFMSSYETFVYFKVFDVVTYRSTLENVHNNISISLRPVHNFSLLQKVDNVLDNLGDILSDRFKLIRYNGGQPEYTNAGNHNAVFQGFYTGSLEIKEFYSTMPPLLRNDNFARYVMHEICQLQNISISKYPKICACVGRGTEVADMRSAVKNSTYRPECHNDECLAGTKNSEVFKYTPALPCSKLTICKQNVNLNFTRNLNIENLNVNCKFAVEYDPLKPVNSSLHPVAGLSRHLKITGLVFGMIFLLLLFLFCRR
jgi:hypothetical protein